MVPKSWWIAGLTGLLVAALLPLLGNWVRGRHVNRCALDGAEVDPRLRVRLVDDHGQQFVFCALRCAELWLEASGTRAVDILVTDESTGEEIEAANAYYVRSGVVTHATTGERRHVFRRETDARAHAEAFRGRLLEGPQRPFAKLTAK